MQEYDDKAITAIAQLEAILRSLFRGSLSETTSGDHQQNLSNTSSETHKSGLKLKAAELKKFNSDFEKWLPFWEIFTKAVHENNKLSGAEKFNYLSNSIIGRAASTIEGFTPTERCYKEAIELLQEEYGHTDKLIEQFVQKLMNLRPVQPNHVLRLRKLYNEVISTMRTLTAFQINSTIRHYGKVNSHQVHSYKNAN